MPVTATALWWHASAAAGRKATPYTRTHVGGLLVVGGEAGRETEKPTSGVGESGRKRGRM